MMDYIVHDKKPRHLRWLARALLGSFAAIVYYDVFY